MLKYILWAFLFLPVTKSANGQNGHVSQDSIVVYFEDVKIALERNLQLWNQDLYGAILLVDPQTRQVYANEPDSAYVLQPMGSIYSGFLPDNMNIGNSAIQWSGKSWAMLMLPLPKEKHNRVLLMAHELFHKAQPSLGFPLHNPSNNHLDQKDGRIYLRLELEALKKAISTSAAKDQKKHLANAFTFRKYRHMLYNGADSTENLLELNEGMAEFTGLICSETHQEESVNYLTKSINNFFNNTTFVRSFAYHTTPVYGYLLYQRSSNWNQEIKDGTNLTSYFMEAMNIKLPKNIEKNVERIMAIYDGNKIVEEETVREEKRRQLVMEYKGKLIEQPHFDIKLEAISVSFDPRNIVPLEDKGTVYPTIRIIDNWGILTVEKGALMSPKWDKITVTVPTNLEGGKITGDGWILELNNAYKVEKDQRTGSYRLVK